MKMLRNVLVALIMGILCVGTGFFDLKNVPLWKIILLNSYAGVEYYPQDIPEFTFQYMQLFFFQILFATYIYRHFQSASIYFFSRNANRKRWFLKEVAKIYFNAVIYLVVACLAQIIVISMFTKITIDIKSVIIALYYIVIHSLYLLAITLAVNIVSVIFSGTVGFISVQSIILFSISIFFWLGNYVKDGVLSSKIILLIKYNLVTNLFFLFHNSEIESVNKIININNIDFDLNFSILYYLVICIGLIIMGCFVVERYEFITNTKEMG